jgi:sarcosine oxidase subunit delta
MLARACGKSDVHHLEPEGHGRALARSLGDLRPSTSGNQKGFRTLMSFLIPCPQCGPRSVYEYRFGGEVKVRPTPGAPDAEWFHYTYTKTNSPGVQKEWWLPSLGLQAVVCRRCENTTTNEVTETWLPE